MSVINILSPHVADLIAAGEVVERPASVVKELMENAIDAGARNISVEIRGGGRSLIRVTDDGCGMSPEDAGVAFLRHATSKLRDARGLESIATLGFRGEALAAISAVSKIELLTRERGAASGTRVLLTGGDIEEMGPAGCPEGPEMRVRELFFNTPARAKFMKSDRSEGGACASIALRCALGHPEVSVRLIREGEEVFFSPGDGQIQSAVYALLGRENAANMLLCRGESDDIRVEGYVSAPHAGRGNRAMQFFFLNGRAFKSLTIQAALEQAYANRLLTGRYPGCAIYLTLPFGRVDVNVHPAKTEVKFTEEKKVFDAVYYAVLSALEGERKTAEITLSAGTRKAAQPREDFYKHMPADQYRASAGKPSRPAPPSGVQQRMDFSKSGVLPLRQDASAYGPSRISPRVEVPRVPTRWETAPVSEAPKTEVPPVIAETPAPDFRVIGETMHTYILVEDGEALLLIDKHAAHERMIFDRLKAQGGEVMSQTLLTPVTFSPGAEDTALLLENAALLGEMGFELEPYGQGSIILRAVPADLGGSETALLEELCEKFRRGGEKENRRDEILHTVACKAAIKAGWDTDDRERRVIAEKVLSGEVRYCPHGRPVSVRLTKKELDRQFMRLV